MKVTFSFLAVLLFTNSLFPQEEWQKLSSKNYNYTITIPAEGWRAYSLYSKEEQQPPLITESIVIESNYGKHITLDLWIEPREIELIDWLKEFESILVIDYKKMENVQLTKEKIEGFSYIYYSEGEQIIDSKEYYFKKDNLIFRIKTPLNDIGGVIDQLLTEFEFNRSSLKNIESFELTVSEQPEFILGWPCGGFSNNDCNGSNPYPCCNNNGNCTWWAWHEAKCNWNISLPSPWKHAKYWATELGIHGYNVSSTPTVNSIACRNIGDHGHVAWVIEVNSNNIKVTEQNCCSGCSGGVRTTSYPLNYFNAGYITPPYSYQGYAKISNGINVNQMPMILNTTSTINFTFREINGLAITFSSVALELVDGNGSILSNVHTWNNVTVSANGSTNLSTNYTPSSFGPGSYKLRVRGSVNGIDWFTFTTTETGNNPRPIYFVNSAGSGGWVSVDGISVNPEPISFDENYSVSFTLKELWGTGITFENIAVAILNEDYSNLYDLEMLNNISISGGGTYYHTSSGTFYSSNPPGLYRVVIRGRISGGNWFDFMSTVNVQNPQGFRANEGAGASDGYALISNGVNAPDLVTLGESFNISFTLEEIHGQLRHFDEIKVSILDPQNNFVKDLPIESNINIPPVGGYTYNKAGVIEIGNQTGYYKAVARGRAVEGGGTGNWFDFLTLESGTNPKAFLVSSEPESQFIEQTSISLVGAATSSVAWGDYDNDGDLDILLTGQSSTGPIISKIYKNNGDNSFSEQTSISLTGVYTSSAAWGDYDNDGDLDILLSGSTALNPPLNPITKIYKNNSDNTFTEQTSISLPGVFNSSVAWGDYDNDGDLDILITGYNNGGIEVSKIYKNNGNNLFTEQTSISLIGTSWSSVAWGDYDNDGDLDILLTGQSSAGRISKVYRNNETNTFEEQTTISLTGVSSSSVAWGDYDNDGDLDILITGYSDTSPISKIYRNNGNNTFTEQTSIILTGISMGSVAWGDYDNDGDLDALLTGYTGSGNVSKIYRNNGDNSLTEQTSISLVGVSNSSVVWGDYDSDGDLDILLTGSTSNGYISKIYRNNNVTQNAIPSVPTNLSITINGSEVTFSWDKSTDNETPQNGLKYNLVIGTSPNAINILSPMSDRNTGYRRVINLGNTNHNNGWTIKGLEPGTYYWSVQAIDNNFAGSNFAIEKSFSNLEQFTEETSLELPNVAFSSIAWGDYDNDGDLDLLLTGDTTMYAAPPNPISRLFSNNGNNTFTELTSISLAGVWQGSVAWGDYDNDSDLDILLTGSIDENWNKISKIYKNNGDSTFTEQTTIFLYPVAYGSVAWGDYDNDGDLDILLSGDVTYIYKNNGDNSFTGSSISLIYLSYSSVAWGDYDNDGDLDILASGYSNDNALSLIYRNDGNDIFTLQTSITLTGVTHGSVAWGDYNNDGYLDIIITGSTASGGPPGNPISKIYKNNGDNSFSEQTSIELMGVLDGTAEWGDYDNDGDLDILLTGTNNYSTPPVSKIYSNNGDNTFSEKTSINLTGVYQGSVAWGDYDNDGDLDILLTGRKAISPYPYVTPATVIYRNNNIIPNNSPSIPANLSSLVSEYDVTLSWDKSIDNETPQNGLKYNLVMGTTPNTVNTLSPMSDRNTGYRRIINLGNANHNNSWTIKSLSPGTYYWSIQALDNNFTGSNFASEQSFVVFDQFSELPSINLAGVSSSAVAWGDYDNDGDLDILLTGYNINDGAISKVFRNEGNNSFNEQSSILLAGINLGSAEWGDYNNDGYLDILLAGETGNGTPISKIYRNDGNNSFTEQANISLTGVKFSSVAWGDYDNDGDLDLLLCGDKSSIPSLVERVTQIYMNDGFNNFAEQTSISLPEVYQGSVIWGDIDNDSDLDFILTGRMISGSIAKLYINNSNNTFTEQLGISLIGVRNSSIDLGDYDNDGDLDLLLTGSSSSGYISKIYRNDGGSIFTEQTSISLIGVQRGSVAWGDYDNDGYLDILLTGNCTGACQISKVYRNNRNNTFTQKSSIILTDVIDGAVAWGDYDNDGDLDILLTGAGYPNPNIRIAKIYRNNTIIQNTLPTSPINLISAVGEEGVTFNWSKSTDSETPQNGIKYNLVIGTTPNAINTMSPMSDRNTGYRRIINLGNANHNNSWTIKGLEGGTYYWSVQALDNNFAGSAFSSEQSFTILTPENWITQVALQDAGGTDSGSELLFGQKPNATNGIDTTFGESELPTVPPIGTFDARFILPTVTAIGSLIDIRDSSETELTWTLTFQPGPAGYPMTFNWDTLSFPPGTFYLTDVINGNIINVNMRNQSSYTITDQTISSLYIKYQRFATSQLTVNIANGWNMISVPGLHPVDQNVNTWWAFRDMGANVFRYAGGYQPVTTATPGTGYWMKHAGARTYNTGDEWPSGGIQIVAHDPIAGASGWNLFGGYELIVTAANVTTNPPGLQSGPIYKYSGGYQTATTIDPGYGYWIKLSAAGQIIIPETLAKDGKPAEYFPDNWGRIVITDASGVSYTLYAVNGEVDLTEYELPPAPMAGMFDIRFRSGRIAEDINSAVKTIDMSGVVYPLTVRVEGMDIRLMDETGKNINVNLKSGEDVVIRDATIQKLMVTGEMIPAEYALEQNYPNPFNPSTMIKFALPKDSEVNLSIYNILGEMITTLVNEEKKSGYYEVNFDAANFASGVYLYRIKAGDFVSTKKMILMK